MFWFTFKNKKNDTGVADEPIHKTRPELMDLRVNDAELRIWVPEPLRLSMDQVVSHLHTTLSKYLREYFVVYLYGSHALIDMHHHQTGIFYKPPQEEMLSDDAEAPRFSRARSVEFIPGLGKNIVPLKLFLNAQIKMDLQKLADKAGTPLSQFVREILVSHFLGHTVWPER